MEVLALIAALNAEPEVRYSQPNVIEVAAICFKSGESTSGMNKICYYDCLSGTKAITIKTHQLCPLSIRD